MIRILMAQVRADGDPMIGHEQACVRRRLGTREYELKTFNALVEPARVDMLDDVHFFLIGGSGDYSVHHPLSHRWVEPIRPLIQRALDEEIAALGICFGHQLLGHHLGSPVVTDPEQSELGTVEVSLTDAGRAAPLFSGLNSTFKVHTGHTDRVSQMPSGVQLLASNERCETQAFHVRGTHFYSVQFHPDMTGGEARDRIRAYREGFSSRLEDDGPDYALCFEVGADESCSLIGSMADLAQRLSNR